VHFPRTPRDGFEQWELDLIGREVAAFEREGELLWSDTDDLLAEAQAAWWRQRESYDPRRGANPETFLKRVVRHALADVLKAERAGSRRGGREALSLDAPLDESGDEGALTIEDVIGSGEDWAEADFRQDLEAILGRLTPRQRAVIRGLRDGEEKAALARRLGVHRDTLYQDLAQIRAVFRDGGLF